MYKRIGIPLDGSKLAERALAVASDLAERFSASLVLIAVLDKPEATNPDALRILEGAGVWTGVPRPPTATPEGRLSAYLDQVSAQLPVSAPIRTAVRHGDVASEIVAAAVAEEVDLIVMTTRGRTGFARVLLGSVADRVVHTTDLPILLVRSDVSAGTDAPLGPFKHVIVPLNGSRHAEAALAHAEAMAKAYKATVVPLKVIEAPTLAYSATPYVWTGNYVDELDRALTADAQQYLKTMTSRITRAGYDATPMVKHGVPTAKIFEVAEAKPESVIVMSTRGHSGVTRWVLGSVADGMVHTASMPVLLVRTDDLA
ncbi:MAG: universal stress protein [Chloroflexi bacterium]|nr:universal stress protein [Chloroflexota bacterium]